MALMVASVPELTIRILSMKADAHCTSWPKAISLGAQRKTGPLPNGFSTADKNILRSMPQNHRPPRQDVVNIAVAIDIMQIVPPAFLIKSGWSPQP